MSCIECGLESLDVKLKEVLDKYQVPFRCSLCGSLKFPIKALNGVVFIWPEPIPDLKGAIYIPEKIREVFKTTTGVILSSGKGVVEKRTGAFIASEFKQGDVVLYDKNVPWNMEIEGSDGKKYKVSYMNLLDIAARIEEN